jgi:hypothetical protein
MDRYVIESMLLTRMVAASVARAESLCDSKIVSQILEARYGEAVIEPNATQELFNSSSDRNALACNVYNQPTFRVIVIIGPPEGRPWVTDIYFVTKKTTFTKAEAQDITEIISEFPGVYSKEISATLIHFGLENYF